jgi:hypothetical protein
LRGPAHPSRDVSRKLDRSVIVWIAVDCEHWAVNAGQQVIQAVRGEFRRQPDTGPGIQHPPGSLPVPELQPGERVAVVELPENQVSGFQWQSVSTFLDYAADADSFSIPTAAFMTDSLSGCTSLGVELVSARQDDAILACMTLSGAHITDCAVAVLLVVPRHEFTDPTASGLEIGKTLARELRPIFGGSEERRDKCIVVADPRA